MPAFAVVDIIKVTDPDKFGEYRGGVVATVEAFGGKYLAMGGETRVMEGAYTPTTPVIIQFPTMDAALGWYNSKEYAPLLKLRLDASEGTFHFVDGLPG